MKDPSFVISKYQATCAEIASQAGDKADKATAELEVRVRGTTKEVYSSLYKKLLAGPEGFGAPELDCSINIISANLHGQKAIPGRESSHILRLSFVEGIRAPDTYTRKASVARSMVSDFMSYGIVLATETPVPTFKSSPDALVRFKLRVSFPYTPPGNASRPQWRFDLTAVKSGSMSGSIGPALKELREAIFPHSLRPDNLFAEVDFGVFDNYELEIEYIGEPTALKLDGPAGLTATVKRLFALVDENYMAIAAYKEELRLLASYITGRANDSRGLKALVNQVVSLDKNTYSAIWPAPGYFVTDKADGVRCVVSIHNNLCHILTSAGMTSVPVIYSGSTGVNIADCEMVQPAGTTAPVDATFYVFDCIALDEIPRVDLPFAERVKLLEAAAAQLKTAGLKAVPKHFSQLPTAEEAAQSAFLARVPLGGKAREGHVAEGIGGYTAEGVFRSTLAAERPYETDGLILTEPGSGYRATKSYKWKPIEKTTIDFLCMPCPEKSYGISPYYKVEGAHLYFLFVGIAHEMRTKLGLGLLTNYHAIFGKDTPGRYYPTHFSPANDPLAYMFYSERPDLGGQIVELSRAPSVLADGGVGTWYLERVRTDRKLEQGYYGNDYRVAEITYFSYADPMTAEDLWMPGSGYFRATAAAPYKPANKFKRAVISALFKRYFTGANWVIDLAAGRGADLHRYYELGVSNGVFIDSDATALAELVRRKFSLGVVAGGRGRGGRRTGGGGPEYPTTYDKLRDLALSELVDRDSKRLMVHVMHADLLQPREKTVAALRRFGAVPGVAQGIACNFAFHYMCVSLGGISNAMGLVAEMLAPGGSFVFTVMDGAKIHKLLAPLKKGASWRLPADNTVAAKYEIRKDYDGDELTQAGQMIAVRLPFAEDLYAEPLANLAVILAAGKTAGLSRIEKKSFSDGIDEVRAINPALVDQLDENDLKYIELHSYVILRKRGEKTGGRTSAVSGVRARK